VRLAVVEVQVQRAARVQDAPDLAQAGREEAQIVVEFVAVGRLREQLGGVPAAAEADAVTVGRAVGDQRAANLGAAGVERRVGVDQLRALVRQLAQMSEVVALEDQRRPPVSAAAAPIAM
jgi:hypothetical protein